LLDALLGVTRPFKDLKEWQQVFESSREQPLEVTAARRIGHLAVLSGLLLFGLVCMVFPGCTPIMETAAVEALGGRSEADLHAFDQAALEQLAIVMVNPDPLVRLGGLVQWGMDQDLHQRAAQALVLRQEESEARQAAMGVASRWLFANFVTQLKLVGGERDLAEGDEKPTRPIRLHREHVRRDPILQPRMDSTIRSLGFIAQILIFPVIWVIWALLWRGGLSFRLMGIDLVRADGRPAARWQCAWRALLVWGPIAVMLTTSVWVEGQYWNAWRAGAAPGALLWVSWATWWFGILLAPAFAILAICLPTRSWQDRLAGTYLVPR
jgi:hypothetical protein